MRHGQWQISLVCSLVFVMEQLSTAINYLERCQNYFLTSSICAIANHCMLENSLLRSVFSTKHISSKINQPNFSEILTAKVDLVLSFCEEERTTKYIQMYFLTSLSLTWSKQTHSLINNLHSLLLTPLVFEITLAVSGIPGQGEKILFVQNLNCF